MRIRPTRLAMLVAVAVCAFATALLLAARGVPVEAGQAQPAPELVGAAKFDDDVNAYAERLALLEAHRDDILNRLHDLQAALAVVDYKITTYGGACGS